MTADLTGLLSYLEGDMSTQASTSKNRFSRRFSVKASSVSALSPEEDVFNITSYVITFRNSSYYKIKCSILQTIAGLTAYRDLLEVSFAFTFIFYILLISRTVYTISCESAFCRACRINESVERRKPSSCISWWIV